MTILNRRQLMLLAVLVVIVVGIGVVTLALLSSDTTHIDIITID